MSKKSRAEAILLATIALTLIAAGVVAWRWMPRAKPKATAAMREATTTMLRDVRVAESPPSPKSKPATQRERLMAEAWRLRDIPYVFGAKGPKTLDCSGFTKMAYGAIGVRVPDGSFNQADGEKPLSSLDQLVPGDLLFYRWRPGDGVSHVTMYAGDGWMIGTGSPGQPKKVVVYPITDDLSDDGRVITYRHIRLEGDAL